MIYLAHDELFLAHDTLSHPENPQRLVAVHQHLASRGLLESFEPLPLVPASDEQILAVHGPELLESLEYWNRLGGGQAEVDTVMSARSYEVARIAAGTIAHAAEKVWREPQSKSLCLVRPPGHHARPKEIMGFCLINSIAVAAQHLRSLGAERLLIIDFDVHHGNGTQEIFYEDESVAFFSSHRFPFYPGTGSLEETGSGAGLGTTANLPLAFGTPADLALEKIERELTLFAERIKPEMLLISAGFDAHRLDPVGNLGWETEHFDRLTRLIVQIAREHCSGKIVSALEGGYHPRKLSESVEAHLLALQDETPDRNGTLKAL